MKKENFDKILVNVIKVETEAKRLADISIDAQLAMDDAQFNSFIKEQHRLTPVIDKVFKEELPHLMAFTNMSAVQIMVLINKLKNVGDVRNKLQWMAGCSTPAVINMRRIKTAEPLAGRTNEHAEYVSILLETELVMNKKDTW